MRHMKLGLAALVLAAAAGCTRTPQAQQSPTPEPKPSPVPTPVYSESVADAETRVHTYFTGLVKTTKLKGCLAKIKAKGLVAVDFTFTKSGDKWVAPKVAATRSNLKEGQDAAAVACLADAVKDSALPVVAGNSPEEKSDTFLIRWTWPVPLPQTRDEVQARMIGGGGLGVDIAGCSDCVSNPNYPYGLKCEAKERGGQGDCKEHSSNVCSTAPTACLRGSFGVAGGAVIF